MKTRRDHRRIVLIDPPGDQKGINAGLLFLAASLRKYGFEPRVLDCNNFSYSTETLIDEIRRFSPQSIGYSIKSATYFSAVSLSRKLKDIFRDQMHCAGGPHVTLYHRTLLRDHPHIAYALCGEAEASLPRLLMSLSEDSAPGEHEGVAFLRDNTIVGGYSCLIEDLDSLPFPVFESYQRTLLDIYPYPLVTVRGCPYRCSFCMVGRISGRRVRNRSIGNIVEELACAKRQFCIRQFEIYDDAFTQDGERARSLCESLIQSNLRLEWACLNGIRADSVDRELVKLMKQSGCRAVSLGVESTDPEVYSAIGKAESLDDIRKAVQLFKSQGIRVGGSMIIGLPHDTCQKTMRSLETSKAMGFDWLHFNMLMPYPGSRAWYWIREHGRFLRDFREGAHFGSRFEPVFEIRGFSAREMKKAYRRIQNSLAMPHLLVGAEGKRMRNLFERTRYRLSRILKDGTAGMFRDLWKLPVLCKVFTHNLRLFFIPFSFSPADVNERKPAVPHMRKPAKSRTFRPRTVLIVNNFAEAIGGAEIYIEQLSRDLKKKGVRPVFIYGRGPLAFSPREDGERAYLLPDIGEYSKQRDSEVQKEFRRIIKKEAPDVIYLHNIWNPSTMYTASSCRPAYRFLHDFHSLCPAYNKILRKSDHICSYPCGVHCLSSSYTEGCMGGSVLSRVGRILFCQSEVVALMRLAGVVVSSNFMRRVLITNGFCADRITVLPPYTSLSVCTGDKAVSSRDSSMIMAIGRFVLPDKGFDYLIEALSLIGVPYRTVLIGDGPARPFLEAKVRDLGLDERVTFTGWLGKEELSRYYRSASMVAISSMWPEPFSLVGLESFTFSLPVVAFDVGGMRDWLHDFRSGFLIPRGNTCLMGKRLETLLSNPALARSMGGEGRRFLTEMDLRNRHINTLMELFEFS